MLSAIVVNYRNAADTAACVSSLLTDEPSAEVVVVDNSAEASHTRELEAALPRSCKLLVSASNSGFAAACNRAWHQTAGEEVMLINPDARVFAGTLSKLRRALLDAKGRGVRLAAVSPLQVWDEAGQWMLPPAWLPTGIGLWALAVASTSLRHAHRLSAAYHRLAMPVWRAAVEASPGVEPIRQRALSGGAVMIRRDAVECLGMLFDERYFMYYEDSDLCLRLQHKGWHVGLLPSAVALHAWMHSGDKVEMMEQAKRQYVKCHFEGKGQWAERLQRASSFTASEEPLVKARFEAEIAWPVPEEIQRGWVLEVSPSPLLIPAIGHFGRGPVAYLPAELRSRIGRGAVFGRVQKLN